MVGSDYSYRSLALYIPEPDPDLEWTWHTTQSIITQLREEVEANGAKFAVAIIPWSVIVEISALLPQQQQAVLQENPVFATADINRPNKRLAEFLNKQKIPFIDLSPLITGHQINQNKSLYFVGDSHWTIEGNRFVGETLSEWLVQNRLVVD